jgi:alkanesulfonate monooxygenase SsuD/methylene tetrahydromethanopterin reductase-like flavin-dependent oxidoreductase (luciferase family)
MRSLLIGIGISTSAAPDADPLAEALAAERLGYDFVSASDHPVGRHPSYETPTLLTWIAARTSRIGIASRVLGVPFRRPAMLAKAAESLQRLSGGRLILGLGAGYSDDEIHALGAAVRSPRAKVEALADAIEIMRRAWTEPSVTYDGAVHSVHALALEPKPEHPIPVWLGTYGNRALAVTGRLADGWIPSLGFLPPARVPELLDRIRTASVAAGRPPDAVRAIYNVAVRLDPGARTSEDTIGGSAADVIEQLQAYAELGFTGFNLMPAANQLRAIADEVLPALGRPRRQAQP